MLVLGACGCRREDLDVVRMTTTLDVRPDGNVNVLEQFTVRINDPTGVTFRRRVPAVRFDGISNVTATIDGAPAVEGTGPGSVHIGPGPGLDVTWIYSGVSGDSRQLGVAYTAANVIELSGIRGVVEWQVLAARRDFDLMEAMVVVRVPDDAIFLQDPWMDEPGWTVTRDAHGFRAIRQQVAATDSATAGIEFTIDHMRPSTPRWQSDQAFTAEFVPAFIAAALFILVTGAGILVMLRIKHPPWRVSLPSGADTTTSPDPLSVTPAMRLALLRGRPRGDRAEMTAALSGLVTNGLVVMDAAGATSVATTSVVDAHEAVLLEALPTQPQPAIAIGTALAKVNRDEFRRAVLEDLTTAGLIDRERAAAARDLRVAGWAVMLFGVAVWIAVQLTVVQFQSWPLVVPSSILIVGLMFAVASSRVGLLSETGARVRMLYFARVRDGRNSE